MHARPVVGDVTL